MAQILFPDPPLTPGQSFVAANGVTYTYDEPFGPGVEGVWTATASPAPSPLTVTAGSITGNPAVGQVLNYVSGVASGGQGPYGLSHEWFVDGVATGNTSPNFSVTSAEAGKAITVTITATDAASATATATTTPVNIPPTLTITNPGTIAGTAEVGATLTYTTGTATGGTGAIAYTWQWFITPSTPIGAIGTQGTITVPAGALNKNIYVKLIATDSATPTANTATADTANFPASGTIQPAGIAGAVAPTTIPGTASFPWTDPSGNLTASGCIEFSVDGGVTWGQTAQPVVSGTTTVQTRWLNVASSGQCGDIPGNGNITGTLTASTGETTTFTFNVNRTPSAFTLSSSTETTTPNTITSTNPSFTLAGSNSPSYIWGAVTGGGGTAEYSVSGVGGPWLAMPSAPGTAKVNPSATVHIRFTTGAAVGTDVLTVNVGASTTSGEFQSGAFTVTVATAPFPSLDPTLASGPTQIPQIVSAVWNDGTQTNLTSTGCIQISKNGTSWSQGPLTPDIQDGETLYMQWDPTGASCGGAAGGPPPITGTLTNGTYTNSYSLLLDKSPTWSAPALKTNVPLTTQEATGVITPTGFNAPVTVSFAAPTAPALVMGNVIIEINGNPTPITVGTTTVTLNPGDTFEILGDTAGANSTKYGVAVTLGSSPAQEWLVETVGSSPAIGTPAITAPLPTTPVNPATNTPAGFVTVKGDGYNPLNGAGAQLDSTWEVYKGSHPLISTNTISATASISPNWTLRTPGGTAWATSPATTGGGIASIGSTFYASGANSTVTSRIIKTSTDGGATWTDVSTLAGTTGRPVLASDGVNLYTTAGSVVPNTTATILKSTNGGVSWNQLAGSASGTTGLNGNSGIILHVNGHIVSMFGGQTSSTPYPAGIYSSDGGTTWNVWRASISGTPVGFRDMAYGNGYYIAVGSGQNGGLSTPCVYISTSLGSTFTQTFVTGIGTGNLSNIAYGNGVWIATSATATSPVVKSTNNGANWTTVNLSSVGAIATRSWVSFIDGYFYLTGNDSELVYSADGTNWSKTTMAAAGGALPLIKNSTGTYLSWGAGGNTLQTANPPIPSTQLSIAGAQTDGFLVGDTIVSNPAVAGPATIFSLDNTKVIVAPQSASWASPQKIERASSMYTAISGSPFTDLTPPLTEIDIAQSAFTTSSTYYARVKYSTNTPSAISSDFSAWSKFTTVSNFVPAIGGALGGGYYAGQINDGGTVYNLIVAPVGPVTQGANTLFGQNGGSSPTGIQYKTSASADTPTATVQNQVYGGLTTDLFKASALHPVFSTFINGATGPNAGAFNLATGGAGGGTGIGGYNDWYLPAKNELEILYFNLKPGTQTNSSFNSPPLSGTNPNSIPPRTGYDSTSNPAANPAQTTNALFAGGAQAFSFNSSYWSSTEATQAGSSTIAWIQAFNQGYQATNLKNELRYARAVRRIAA